MFSESILRVSLLIFLASPFGFCQQPESISTPNGKAIFEQRCSECHGTMGQGISGVIGIAGPRLQAEHTRGQVMMAMDIGPSHMPRFPYMLSIPEMRAVARYITQQIAVIPLAGGNLSEGGDLFRTNCAACHSPAVRGGALAFTGVNALHSLLNRRRSWAGQYVGGLGPCRRFQDLSSTINNSPRSFSMSSLFSTRNIRGEIP